MAVGSNILNSACHSLHSLTFQFNPSSKVYGYTSFDLKPNGEEETVTLDNAEEYIELVTDFCLHTGVRRQMEAFRGTC